MALWYHCGSGWMKTRGLARRDLGADAYLCCPGPSLADVDAPRLNGPGRVIFAVTTAYPAVRPDIWVGTDVPECYDRGLWAQPFLKVVRGSHRDRFSQGRRLRDFPNVLFADLENAPVSEILSRREHDVCLVWNRNTFTTALHLAIWMGAKRIFLVGCDFGGACDYHDGRQLPASQRAGNRGLYSNLVEDLRGLALPAKGRGIGLVSCTPGSPVNEFLPFVALPDALAASEAAVPSGGAPVLHAVEAERCQWRAAPTCDRGVVVGFDTDYEWLAPWWLSHFREHSDLPVVFADFGMTSSMREWCSTAGEVVDVRDVPVACPRLRKPFAILRAPFREILWLDADCEVRGGIEPLLSHCRDGAVWLLPASDNRSGMSADGAELSEWDSGIVVVRHGHPFVVDWAAEALSASGQPRADCDAVARVVNRCGHNVSPIPAPEAANRRGGPSDMCVRHWSGAVGKATLRARSDVSSFAAQATDPPIRWGGEPLAQLGVMVPVCANQQDIVAWWWWAYARHNQWPVAFADFGMSNATRQWCRARGTVIAPGAPIGIKGPFRKPFALLRSPFRRTVWADLDCEIRANISRVADLCDGHPTLGRDWSYPMALRKQLPFEGPCWSTALMVIEQGDPLVSEWAKATVEGSTGFRSDQEILSGLLSDGRAGPIVEIPDSLFVSRQEGEAEGLAAVHWSGPGGKGAIHRAWSAIRAGMHADMGSAFWRGWTRPEPTAERGVIVGLDEGQEWLLDWWWTNYAAHNDLPVLFVDFGMSAAGRQWCVERGTLSALTGPDCYGWFKKPLAVLESPFSEGVWLDTDCEVRGSLEGLFEYCADGGIGMTFDRGTPERFRDSMPPDAAIYNSGLLVFNHGDPVVPQWASMTLALRSDRPGDSRYGQPGDQETLALTLRRFAKGRVRGIPMALARLRLSDGDGPCLVMHWTGPTGKRHISEAIGRRPAGERQTGIESRRSAAEAHVGDA